MKHLATLSALAFAAALVTVDPARAELVPIQWSAAGQFVHEARVAPGGFVEACEKLPAGAKVAWSYTAAAPMDFNIHYHVGKEVKFPAENKGSVTAEGILDAAVDQDYCWMWTNRSGTPVGLKLALRRRS